MVTRPGSVTRVHRSGKGAAGTRPRPPVPEKGATGKGRASGDPVEVAAAGLAVNEVAPLAELLETLGGDGHAASAAEVRLDHLHHGHAAMPQDLVVIVQDG